MQELDQHRRSYWLACKAFQIKELSTPTPCVLRLPQWRSDELDLRLQVVTGEVCCLSNWVLWTPSSSWLRLYNITFIWVETCFLTAPFFLKQTQKWVSYKYILVLCLRMVVGVNSISKHENQCSDFPLDWWICRCSCSLFRTYKVHWWIHGFF